MTGYEESRRILTDRDSYSNDIRHMFHGDGPATSDDIGGLGFTDPPLHTRLRKIVTPEFTMRRLARLEPMIGEIVDRQLDKLAAEGSGADLAKHVAFPVPFQTICALLGLDYEDRGRVREARQRTLRRHERRRGGIRRGVRAARVPVRGRREAAQGARGPGSSGRSCATRAT